MVYTLLNLFIFSVDSSAQNLPVSVECSDFKGKTGEMIKDNIKWGDDQISGSVVYVFSYKDGKIFDTQGGDYAMVINGDNITGVSVYPASSNLVSFFPKENTVMMSKHSNFFDVRLSGWTMVSKCRFSYLESIK